MGNVIHNLTWSERKEKVERLLEEGKEIETRKHPSYENTYVIERGIERDDGKFIEHSEDYGPAKITYRGSFEGDISSMEWKQYGVLHRVEGPAVIRPERNEKEWYWKGARHREDGPAVITEMQDGTVHYSWYLREKCVSKEEVFRGIPKDDRERRREFIKEWGV